MKPLKYILMSWLICAASIQVQAQEKYSKVKISAPDDNYIRSEIIGLLNIDHFETDAKGAIISEISASDLVKLKTLPYKFQVLVDDVAKYLDSLNAIYFASQQNDRQRVAFEQPGSALDNIIPTPAAFEVKTTLGGYYSFPQMEAAMDAFVASYPAIAQKFSIGKTDGNRDIWVIKISDNVSLDETGEPEILYQGLQHAREAITGASMIFFMQYLGENYATDTRIKDLVDNRVIYIIPCLNPDGWEYNRSTYPGGGGMWRKNRGTDTTMVITTSGGGPNKKTDTTYSVSFHTVDLNRNWSVDWANCSSPIQGSSTSCGSGSSSSDTYWGPSAFSEKETQAVRDFAKSRRLAVAFDQHAYGPYYSLPYGRQSLHGQLTGKAAQYFTAIPALAGKYNGMRAADSYDALGYEVAGGFKDWMLTGELGVGNKDTIWAMTGEGGGGGFWPAASRIINLSKGMCYQNIQLAYSAGTYVDIQDASGMAVESLSGNLDFKIKRIGIGNEPVTISLIPYENVISTGAPVVINSMDYYEEITNSISYTLPSNINNGQRMKFIWRVETSGYTYADTVVKLYNPLVLLADDMEGADASVNWNVSGGWAYSSDDAFGGYKSLTESPGGDYAAGSTRTATYNGTLDLSDNTAAYLTFYTRHRAENFRDKLQVRVSTNGSTWTVIPGLTTVKEPGTLDGSTINGQPSLTGIRDYWTQEIFDLTSYKNSTLNFQFLFTSDNTSSSFKYNEDDGFYIDEVQVYKSTTPFVSLPANFTDFTARLIGQKTFLQWVAEIDHQHDYFEVQRSSDGVNFTSIGQITTGAPYYFTDNSPKAGKNYYRIKQIDKDGGMVFTKIILINKKSEIQLIVFPNPVVDELHVGLRTENPGLYTIQILDMYGRQVYVGKEMVNSLNINVIVNVRSFASQVYQVRILNEKNEALSIQSFIKK